MPPNAGLDLLSIVLRGFISLQLTGYDKSDNLEGILKSFIHFFGRDFLNAHFVPMVNDRDFTPALSNLTICFPASGDRQDSCIVCTLHSGARQTG